MAKTKTRAPKPRPRLVPTIVDASPETLARESTNHAEAIARLEVRLSLAETPDDGGTAGGAVTDGDYGDVTVSGGGSVWTVDPLPISRITGLVASLAAKPDTTDLAAIAFTGAPADLVAPVTNAELDTMPTETVKANLTGVTALPSDVTLAALAAALAPFITSGTVAGPGHFGDGSDADVTFDGVNPVTGWTLVGSTYNTSRADWMYRAVTISGGVSLCMQIGGEGANTGCSARYFSSGGITVPSGTATIKLNGATASVFTAPLPWQVGHTGASAGNGSGGIQNAGQNAGAFSGNWFPTFRGGDGGVGGASTTNAGSSVPGVANNIFPDAIGLPLTWTQAVLGRLSLNNPGSISGGGGGGSGGGNTGLAKGGAGGNGGGVLIVGARTVTGNLVIEARGGGGGDGEFVIGSTAGGGSGGGGGIVFAGFGTSTIPAGVTIDISGGPGGLAQGAGSPGGAGAAGDSSVYCLGS